MPDRTLCHARRSDGALCEEAIGHYGGHVWPDVKLPIVKRGDTIRFSVALLKQIHEEPDHLSILVRLVDVGHEPDGSKTLTVERVEPYEPLVL